VVKSENVPHDRFADPMREALRLLFPGPWL
jgi:hypothetical protein